MADFTVSYTGRCFCGCGDRVAMSFAGFSATSVTVAACARLRADGIVSYEVRKSVALEAAESEGSSLRHRTGLVEFR